MKPFTLTTGLAMALALPSILALLISLPTIRVAYWDFECRRWTLVADGSGRFGPWAIWVRDGKFDMLARLRPNEREHPLLTGSPSNVAILECLASSRDDSVRRLALQGLRLTGRDGMSARRSVIACLHDRNPDVRRDANEALLAITGGVEGIVPPERKRNPY